MNLPSRGVRYMFVAAAFFSVMTVFVKMLGTRLPAAEVVFVRSIISLGITYAMLKTAGIGLLGHRRGLLTLRGLVGFVALVCFFYAIPRLPLADVTVIQYTNPVFVALLAAVFLKEMVGVRELLSVALSVVGVLVIARPSFVQHLSTTDIDTTATAVALAGAFLAGCAYILVRKLRETEHALVVVLYFPLVSVPAAVPLMWRSMVWPTATEWLLLGGIGLTTQVAQVYLTKGLHAERAARATAVSYIQIVFAAMWGMTFFGEYPDFPTIVGALLVVGGILIVTRRSRS